MTSERLVTSRRCPRHDHSIAISMLWSCGVGCAVAVRMWRPSGGFRLRRCFQRTRVFLAAADYRRAIEESQRYVMERPSVLSYVVLTYV